MFHKKLFYGIAFLYLHSIAFEKPKKGFIFGRDVGLQPETLLKMNYFMSVFQEYWTQVQNIFSKEQPLVAFAIRKLKEVALLNLSK